jgi:hypothetical protein
MDRLEGFVLLWKQEVGIEGKGFDSYWLPCVVDRLEGFVLLWKQKVGMEGKGFDYYWLSCASWTGLGGGGRGVQSSSGTRR